jgi:hypothetical protein
MLLDAEGVWPCCDDGTEILFATLRPMSRGLRRTREEVVLDVCRRVETSNGR